jgi:hypothetical protein
MRLINKRECVLTLLLLAATRVAGGSDAHEFFVEVDAGLEQMSVVARFAHPVSRLRARSSDASRFLDHIERCTGERLLARGREVDLGEQGSECVRYSIDLAGLARSDRRNASLDPRNVLVPPSAWLWRPWPRDRRDAIVIFELPAGVGVSPPWERLDERRHHFRVRPSPESASAAVAFGRFESVQRPIPGAVLQIAVMKPRSGPTPVDLADWVAAAAANVALSYGRFPNPDPHAIVIPVGGDRGRSGSPVPFGRVLRDGGEAVELFVDQHSARARLDDDWTATHEFSHFMLPYVSWRQRWVSEGFAQYYQNVLLARAGQYDVQRAWQKLYEGFERGRRARPEMSPNEAAEQRPRGATMKIYWAGAALALEADVELRRRSGGSRSLDTVLDAFAACCLPSPRTWSGRELFEKFDALAGERLFVPLYQRYANAAGFPDYGAVMKTLGLVVRSGRVRLTDTTPHTGIRDAIMSGPGGSQSPVRVPGC